MKLTLAVILLSAIVFYLYSYKVKENFNTRLYGRPNKCFDCEKNLTPETIHLGFPSKCFDCERQNNGISRYNTGPTKCFDCDDNIRVGNNTAEEERLAKLNGSHRSLLTYGDDTCNTVLNNKKDDINCNIMCQRNKIINKV
jgi:hypothetical protein